MPNMPDEAAIPSHYPNQLGRILLLALKETVGQAGAGAVLIDAGLSAWVDNYPPDNLDKQFEAVQVSRIMTALERVFGPNSGRGFALLVGQSAFKYGLRTYGGSCGVSDLDFRLLPPRKKIGAGLNILADTLNRLAGPCVQLDEQENQFVWHLAPCPFCAGRETDSAVCLFVVGVLQASLSWLSGGKYFQINETHCAACAGAEAGATCTFVINKKPME